MKILAQIILNIEENPFDRTVIVIWRERERFNGVDVIDIMEEEKDENNTR